MTYPDLRHKVVAYAPSRVYYRDDLFGRIAAAPDLDFTAIYRADDYHQEGAIDTSLTHQIRYLHDGYPHATGVSRRSEVRALWQLLNELDPDILLLSGYHSWRHQLAIYFQKARRKPLLLREDMTLLSDRPVWRKAAKQVGLRATLHTAFGLYVGSENRCWFEHFGVPDHRLFFTPHAVDNDFFRANCEYLFENRPTIRSKFELPNSEIPVILTVCRLHEKKGLPVLLDAFADLRRDRHVALAVAGDGPLREQLESQAARDGVPDVHFLGRVHQSDLPALYTASDVFVLASSYDETWGLVVNEAMNCRLPIVVSDQVGSGYDLVRDGYNGFVFPAGNARALAEKLEILLANPAMARSFGKRSSDLIEPWNHDVAANGVLAAIEDSLRLARGTVSRCQ